MPSTATYVDPRQVRYVPMALWLIDHEDDVSPTAARVYAALASLYNVEEGGAWPGWERLSELVHRSRRTIARTLAELEELELIVRTRRGNGRSNFYEFPDHPWMHEHEAAEVPQMTPPEVPAGGTSKDNFSRIGSTPVLRTGRHALRTAAPPAERSRIRAVASDDFGGIDSPALGDDPDDPVVEESTTRRRSRRRDRPADPADWNALELGEFFVARCSKAVTSGAPLMESFVGIGSAKAVAAHARRWMDAGVAPAQIKLDIEHFVDNYGSYRIKGVKPDRAFLAQIAGIREKTLRQSAYDDDDAFVMKTEPARKSRYASS